MLNDGKRSAFSLESFRTAPKSDELGENRDEARKVGAGNRDELTPKQAKRREIGNRIFRPGCPIPEDNDDGVLMLSKFP